MELYNLGKVPWKDSQLMYHALAELGRESLCLLSPSTPYVCIGFHQDADQEVDLEFCRTHDIPVFRREVGGGAVFLDGNQLFFQIILHRDNSIAPKRIDAFYKKFLQPVIEVHHRIGIAAEYKPVNDLIVANRKISGTGAAEIGDSIVFVGNLILDFDYKTMSRVLKIPDEKFRDKVKKTIEENLSTIRRELGEENYRQWDEPTLNQILVEEFDKLLGPLRPSNKDQEIATKMKELETSMINDAWLFQKGKRVEGRIVKVRSGLEVVQRMHKTPGGLIRAEFAVENGKYKDVNISGDFFCFPKDSVDRLAAVVEDCPADNVCRVIQDFYETNEIDILGVTPDDWIQVIKI
ncbi:MAG: lipoate--protein ligase [Thermodesulfobacteriota bacterium]